MIISNISVTGLFRSTDANISINSKQRVTVIHAPNGFGKTTIFKIVHAIFNRNFDLLKEIPFDNISLTLIDQGKNKTYDLQIGKDGNSSLILTIEDESGKKIDLRSLRSKMDQKEMDDLMGKLMMELENLQIERNYLAHRTYKTPSSGFIEVTTRINDIKNIIDSISGREFADNIKINDDAYNQIKLMGLVNIKMIESQRLYTQKDLVRNEYTGIFNKPNQMKKIQSSDSRYVGNENGNVSTVEFDSNDLLLRIREAKIKYAKTSQSIDRAFPSRVIQLFNQQKGSPKQERIDELTKDLEEKKINYSRCGLIDSYDYAPRSSLELNSNDKKVNEYLRKVLLLYLQDTDKKLKSFEQLYAQIDLFTNIINSKFKGKKIAVNSTDGIQVVTCPPALLEQTIPLDYLSSGEQHQIVINYDLIFKTQPNSLVLIDEPEISQDISWQHDMLDDFQKMAELGNYYILVATHSPQIVGNKFELLQELGG